jgi:glutaredoxin
MTITRLKPARCPHCHMKIDAFDQLDDETIRPSPDDLTVCIYCGEVSQFDRKLRPRRVPASVLAALTPGESKELRETQAKVRAFIEYMNPR